MKEFWKIEKEWVTEWGLTASECIILADLLAWDCSVEERAKRCKVSRRTAIILTRKVAVIYAAKCRKCTFQSAENALSKCRKCTFEVQNLHFQCAKIAHYTYIEEIRRKCEEMRAGAHTHTHTHEGEGDGKKLVDGAAASVEENEKPTIEGEQGGAPQVPQVPQVPTSQTQLIDVEKAAAELLEEMQGDTQTAERFERLYHLPRSKIAEAVPIFRDKLLCDGTDLKSRGDFRRHFNAWLAINAKRIFNELNNNGKQTTNNNARDNEAYIAGLYEELYASLAG